MFYYRIINYTYEVRSRLTTRSVIQFDPSSVGLTQSTGYTGCTSCKFIIGQVHLVNLIGKLMMYLYKHCNCKIFTINYNLKTCRTCTSSGDHAPERVKKSSASDARHATQQQNRSCENYIRTVRSATNTLTLCVCVETAFGR